MIEIYRKIFALLDSRERKRFILLSGVMILVAISELLGISAVLLLLTVLSEPDRIPDMATIGWLYEKAGFQSLFAFQVLLAVIAIAVVMGGLAIKAAGTYAVIRYAEMRGYAISCRLLGAYLHQPYAWFLRRNSAEIGKDVLQECIWFVGMVLGPAMRILSSLLIAVFILVFLVVLNPLVAPVAGLLIGGSYALIYLWLRSALRRLGGEIVTANSERFRLAHEATAGIKEVKLLGLEDSYLRRFESPAQRFARASALNNVASELPRFALEAITFGVLLGVVLILLLHSGGSLVSIVPLLGVFAFGTLRLLPALQQIYHAATTLRFGRAVLDRLYSEYTSAMAEVTRRRSTTPSVNVLPLTRVLSLKAVSYAYPESERTALDNVSLDISAYTTVGIVGGTGAGKTTLVDLILGLLVPDSGTIRVDGMSLGPDTQRSWQRTLGYVPQNIYLTDDTVAANIAFGIPPEQIDIAKVERAARVAALHDFVVDELPEGYDTFVGERGVRLSGGQRQRIGIARALYHEPSLLILDEATSALDNLTERAVMGAVDNIRGDKTIILIAHRLSTVRKCHTIFLMERGRVAARGTYDELVADNDTFRRMADGT